MASFKHWLVVAVAVGFAGTAAASDPWKSHSHRGGVTIQPFPHHHHHHKPFPIPVPHHKPHPFPNPGPFPPRPLPFPVPPPKVDFDFVVLARPSVFFGWQVYGRYETAIQAQLAARRLELNGVPVRVETVRGGGFGW